MTTTLFQEDRRTISATGETLRRCPDAMLSRYAELLETGRIHWTEYHHLERRLGSGGQGVVYLTMRRGSDHFTLPVAVKIFSPERYENERTYDEAMERIARVSARVALIQQDNLLDVHNFVEQRRIRLMEMEWIDGYDLARLLTPEMLQRTHERVNADRWKYLNNVIVTSGPQQSRLKPGIAIAIVRECLAALAALHRDGIVHGDIKSSNIMIKRTGNAKIIDIGSALELDNIPTHRTCTPAYAAPEVLEGRECSPRSDLASLGYVLVEMLSGRPPFAGLQSYRELLEAKRSIVQNLSHILPAEVSCNELLMNFCRGLIAPDPGRRFPSAEAADLVKEGAASFHRQLIVGGLASEYENEIRLWLEELE
ncbi:MAG: serine/threonine-protein kinase [Planctomycetota bacterium]|jgi:eukaryotic-like serine/threonine-protein kinase|nr:serine/threonine protein kinase [Pirellulales bacterium]RLS32869.1 MAG: serine/threonine protein kinase [Planctomycetota bacterium]RLS59485.1 MAG: serine/threonine protein kinase [Planctomycetota bacterium]RLS99100.1 MAG: serine/threonine protein kinase [Planctomycetota bacterium]